MTSDLAKRDYTAGQQNFVAGVDKAPMKAMEAEEDKRQSMFWASSAKSVGDTLITLGHIVQLTEDTKREDARDEFKTQTLKTMLQQPNFNYNDYIKQIQDYDERTLKTISDPILREKIHNSYIEGYQHDRVQYMDAQEIQTAKLNDDLITHRTKEIAKDSVRIAELMTSRGVMEYNDKLGMVELTTKYRDAELAKLIAKRDYKIKEVESLSNWKGMLSSGHSIEKTALQKQKIKADLNNAIISSATSAYARILSQAGSNDSEEFREFNKMSGEELVKRMGMEEAFRSVYTGEMDGTMINLFKKNIQDSFEVMEEAEYIVDTRLSIELAGELVKFNMMEARFENMLRGQWFNQREVDEYLDAQFNTMSILEQNQAAKQNIKAQEQIKTARANFVYKLINEEKIRNLLIDNLDKGLFSKESPYPQIQKIENDLILLRNEISKDPTKTDMAFDLLREYYYSK